MKWVKDVRLTNNSQWNTVNNIRHMDVIFFLKAMLSAVPPYNKEADWHTCEIDMHQLSACDRAVQLTFMQACRA